MEDLVGVRVSNPAEQPRIRERPLERMVLASQSRREVSQVGVQHLQPSAVELLQRVRALYDVDRCPSLRARLGEVERPSLELERSLRELSANRLSALSPAETTRDHEMNDDVQRVVRPNHNALTQPADGSHPLADR